jgi:hypothetical protein
MVAVSQTMRSHDLTSSYWRQLGKLSFRYLPDYTWLKSGGYTGMSDVGLYKHQVSLEEVYIINVLSESSIFILSHNDRFVGAKAITTDEELLRFLSSAKFPLPA